MAPLLPLIPPLPLAPPAGMLELGEVPGRAGAAPTLALGLGFNNPFNIDIWGEVGRRREGETARAVSQE